MATVPTNHITTIKYFRFLRTFYQDAAIFSPQIKLHGALSAKVWWILFVFVHFTLASVAFLFFKANTIGERAYSYYTTVTLIFCLSYFLCNALKMPKIVELIEDFDEFIRKSTVEWVLLLLFFKISFSVEIFLFFRIIGSDEFKWQCPKIQWIECENWTIFEAGSFWNDAHFRSWDYSFRLVYGHCEIRILQFEKWLVLPAHSANVWTTVFVFCYQIMTPFDKIKRKHFGI